MDKLRIKNYRCLEDTGEIELRPITLLVGANSTGKSSFIKFFPLLQQSIGTKVKGLFLWDGRNVDFKDFKNTVRNHEGEIEVRYVISDLKLNLPMRKRRIQKNVIISFTVAQVNKDYDYLRQLRIEYEDVCFTYQYGKKGECILVKANGLSSSEIEHETIATEYSQDLFPTIMFNYKLDDTSSLSSSSSPGALAEAYRITNHPVKSALDLFEFNINERRTDYVWKEILNNVQCDYPGIDAEHQTRLAQLQLYRLSGLMIQCVNSYFSTLANKFTYVLPLRSIMQRYYRFQNRDEEQIDSDGGNLAMFLNGLSESQLKDYQKWLKIHFNFEIATRPSEGHIEIVITETGKPERNLVDVGFGYTQILPILTIIWKSVYNRKETNDNPYVPIIIAIEQPELHLHPRFQADFARLLAKIVSNANQVTKKVIVIMETHSETIVNELGRQIESNECNLTTENVGVVLFDAMREGMDSYVHTTQFSEDGFLQQWPFGFFSDNVY